MPAKLNKKKPKKSGLKSKLSRNLVYVILLLLALPLMVVVLAQTQSFSPYAQTVPSPACLGPCPTTSNTQTSISPAQSQPCISAQPEHWRDRGGRDNDKGLITTIIEFLMQLISALFGGGFNSAPSTTPVVNTVSTAPAPSSTPSSTPCPPASVISSAPSTAGGAGANAGAPATECVVPAGMTALLDQDTSDSQLPWKRTGPGKVVITFETKGVPAEWVTEMQRGVDVWNKSACLDTKLVPACQANTNCVPVVVGDGGGDSGNFNAQESGGFTTGGDIQLDQSLTGKVRTNVTIHEMGHAVGLVHRQTENVLMHADDNEVIAADETDYKNLLFLYGSQKP